MKHLIFAPLIFVFISCATVPQDQTASGILENLMGSDAQQVIKRLGPPSEVYSDGGDGYILHYSYSYRTFRPGMQYTAASANWQTHLNGGSAQGQATTLSVPPRTVTQTEFAQVYLTADGTAHYYRHNTQTQAEAEARRKRKLQTQTGLVYGLGIAAVLTLSLSPQE